MPPRRKHRSISKRSQPYELSTAPSLERCGTTPQTRKSAHGGSSMTRLDGSIIDTSSSHDKEGQDQDHLPNNSNVDRTGVETTTSDGLEIAAAEGTGIQVDSGPHLTLCDLCHFKGRNSCDFNQMLNGEHAGCTTCLAAGNYCLAFYKYAKDPNLTLRVTITKRHNGGSPSTTIFQYYGEAFVERDQRRVQVKNQGPEVELSEEAKKFVLRLALAQSHYEQEEAILAGAVKLGEQARNELSTNAKPIMIILRHIRTWRTVMEATLKNSAQDRLKKLRQQYISLLDTWSKGLTLHELAEAHHESQRHNAQYYESQMAKRSETAHPSGEYPPANTHETATAPQQTIQGLVDALTFLEFLITLLSQNAFAIRTSLEQLKPSMSWPDGPFPSSSSFDPANSNGNAQNPTSGVMGKARDMGESSSTSEQGTMEHGTRNERREGDVVGSSKQPCPSPLPPAKSLPSNLNMTDSGEAIANSPIRMSTPPQCTNPVATGQNRPALDHFSMNWSEAGVSTPCELSPNTLSKLLEALDSAPASNVLEAARGGHQYR